MRVGMIEDDVVRLREYVDRASQRGEERLPPEPKLCDALGVSRGRLRTMLKHLEDEGLIWRHVGKGTFVGPRPMAVDDKHAATSISVDDIIAARLLLEPQLAGQAAIHATAADIATLDRCLADMAATDSFPHWKRLDETLHRTIAEATHNALLVMMYDVLRSWVKASLDTRIEEVYGHAPTPKQTTDKAHIAIVESIRSHNPGKAEDAMREHLRAVRTHLFGLR
ncbi:FadR family transcriptional regulator [Burkholderia cenocepacia]|nr:FadR family transcriptional regulator [Burkholderia cenocepacia]RQV33280.1 FadR family transcriptional regulator [Burkholderia cenocepacia]RQZ27017.1 FadR family transcriptional regulator [Burkholderia sp. Bp9090]